MGHELDLRITAIGRGPDVCLMNGRKRGNLAASPRIAAKDRIRPKAVIHAAIGSALG